MASVADRKRIQRHASYASDNPAPFVGWDSEGYNAYVVNSEGSIAIDHRTMLFGCSHFEPIVGVRLTSLDMLRYMMEVRHTMVKAVHIAFSFDYDVNQILQDLSPRAFRNLIRTGSCYYEGYCIAHIPGKMLKIKPMRRQTGYFRELVIYDIFSYFHTSYIVALENFEIGNDATRAKIRKGKSNRSRFSYGDIEYVRSYWKSEIGLLPRLGDSIRSTCYSSGFYCTKWYGPGAIAAYMLKHNSTDKKMSKHNPTQFPSTVRVARQYAYAGGRFEPFKAGVYYGDVFVVDLNSAYVAAMRCLPRLDRGKWSRIDPRYARHHIVDFGLYRIDFADKTPWSLDRMPYPLFHRARDGTMSWPARTGGWYWGPEARNVVDDSRARFLEAWEFSDSEPAFPWVEDYYRARLRLQHAENPAERTYKWGLAAQYGRFAQQVGWNQKTRLEPSSHQIEWAGFITSWCRAQMQAVAMWAARMDGLISIDTDGITSLTPFSDSLVIGENLGEWKSETYHGIIQWQNGVYWLLNSKGKWISKSRGLKRGSAPPVQQVIRAVEGMESRRRRDGESPGDWFRRQQECSFDVPRRRYIGYKEAAHNTSWDRWRQWEDSKYTAVFGGESHNSVSCRRCNALALGRETSTLPLHDVRKRPSTDSAFSHKYALPWLEAAAEYTDPEGSHMIDYDTGRYLGIFPDEE